MISNLKQLGTRASEAVCLSFITVQNALAQDNGVFGEVPDITTSGDVDEQSLRDTVVRIIQDVLSFMALVAVIVIIVAGIRLVVSGADEGQREKARNTVIYAVVGLILILLAQAIVGFVNNFLQG